MKVVAYTARVPSAVERLLPHASTGRVTVVAVSAIPAGT